MSDWKPKPKADAKTEDMNLTGEEGFVLSRVDGFTSLANLAHLTSLPEGRVKQILNKLVRQGAVDADVALPAAPVSSARPRPQPAAEAPSTVVDELSSHELREILGETGPTMDDEPPMEQATETDQGDAIEPAPAPQVDEPFDEPTMAEDDIDASSEENPEESEGASEEEKAEDEASEGDEANARKLYNTELAKLEQPEREAMAKSAKEPHLSALCFDPHHAVIARVFENPSAGLQHARLVARNHHTPQGLDIVIHRAELFRDLQVQRLLLQNTMLQEPQLKRILQPKRLAEIYKVALSREIPEKNRQKSRGILRSKWSMTDGEERAGLVFTTEGRCLMMLTGLPFDSQTTSLLCQKTYTSLLLIQNLARFGASPPQLLSHLLKQAIVRRQPHLRTLITQHPNCPGDAKRRA